jgi:putative transposase
MHLEQSLKKYRLYHAIVSGYRYYVVCCPKYRYTVLHTLLDPRLQELILAKQEPYGYRVLDMEAMLDRVHLLLDINPQSGMSAAKPLSLGTGACPHCPSVTGMAVATCPRAVYGL